MNKIILEKVEKPQLDNSGKIEMLTDATMAERKNKILNLMEQSGLDTLIVYCDLEHGGNFSYLTGFVTRFEESLCVLHRDGKAYLVLGNENTKMIQYSRLEAELIHTPFFSLPDQPMDGEEQLTTILEKAQLKSDANVGIAGWKMFTAANERNDDLFDVPYYLVEAVKSIVSEGTVKNRTDLFIHAGYGARSMNNGNEIAHYEFGASLASDCVLSAVAAVQLGKAELEIADQLVRYGQLPTVVPIAATGERFQDAYIYPRNNQVKLGDKMSITTGFKGGLSSRSGYAVSKAAELPVENQDYLEKVAIPYYNAFITWLEQIRIGMTGAELYRKIDVILPQETFHWHLNPGHLTADEEWMSSLMKKDSTDTFKSGMLLQIDIIPSIEGYAGASCESGIALADETLRQELQREYPALWRRFEKRRRYLKEILNINVPEWVLPMSSGVAFYSPFFLADDQVLKKQRQ